MDEAREEDVIDDKNNAIKQIINVLVINTLTELCNKLEWNIISTKYKLNLTFEFLPEFKDHFKPGYIEDALVYADPILRNLIQTTNPNILIVHSKGVAIVTYLAFHNIWTGNVILSSPIPNTCNHLSQFIEKDNNKNENNKEEEEDTWLGEWNAIIKVLERIKGKIGIGIGNSFDEEELIESYLLKASQQNNWLIKKSKGDHDWLYQQENLPAIAELIEYVIEK